MTGALARNDRAAPARADAADQEDVGEWKGSPMPQVKARAPAPWFRLNVDKWNSMTRNLNPVETVLLLTILCECHQRGEPLPEDPSRLAKRCKTTKPAIEKATATLISERLVFRHAGGLWSDYIGDEIAHREERAEQASQNVKKRWEKNQQNQRRSDTNVAKSIRGIEIGEVGGENPPPNSSPSPSSSTIHGCPRSTFDGCRDALDSASSTSHDHHVSIIEDDADDCPF